MKSVAWAELNATPSVSMFQLCESFFEDNNVSLDNQSNAYLQDWDWYENKEHTETNQRPFVGHVSCSPETISVCHLYILITTFFLMFHGQMQDLSEIFLPWEMYWNGFLIGIIL